MCRDIGSEPSVGAVRRSAARAQQTRLGRSFELPLMLDMDDLGRLHQLLDLSRGGGVCLQESVSHGPSFAFEIVDRHHAVCEA
jgi:hypothetical protein